MPPLGLSASLGLGVPQSAISGVLGGVSKVDVTGTTSELQARSGDPAGFMAFNTTTSDIWVYDGTAQWFIYDATGVFAAGEQDVIDLEPAAWWDASYADSVTHSGGAVSSWMSREGNEAELVQGTGSAQPTFDEVNADFNDLSTLRFTTSASSVIQNSSVYIDGSGNVGTIFIVGKCGVTPSSAYRIANWGDTQGNLGVNFDGGSFFVYKTASASWQEFPVGVTNQDLALFMVGIHLDSASSYASSNEGTNVAFSAGAGLTPASGVTALGRYGGTTPDWDCAEYIIFDTALDATDFAKVETYLKNKYDGF